MHSRTITLLKNIGLSSREMGALNVLPAHTIQDRPGGYGLIGGTGVGKTWHLAQRIGGIIGRMVDAHPMPDTATMPHAFARWLNWPQTAENLKVWVGSGYNQDLDDFLARCSTCRQLYLDDLGQERIVGQDDYSLGILRTILDARYREDLPVFWTSNLDMPALNKVYGARIVSRMIDAWPPVKLTGPDRRLQRAAGGL